MTQALNNAVAPSTSGEALRDGHNPQGLLFNDLASVTSMKEAVSKVRGLLTPDEENAVETSLINRNKAIKGSDFSHILKLLDLDSTAVDGYSEIEAELITRIASPRVRFVLNSTLDYPAFMYPKLAFSLITDLPANMFAFWPDIEKLLNINSGMVLNKLKANPEFDDILNYEFMKNIIIFFQNMENNWVLRGSSSGGKRLIFMFIRRKDKNVSERLKITNEAIMVMPEEHVRILKLEQTHIVNEIREKYEEFKHAPKEWILETFG